MTRLVMPHSRWRWPWVCQLLRCLLVAGVVVAVRSASIEDILRTAESLIGQDQGGELTTRARSLLHEALAQDPHNAVANFLMGTSHHLQNDLASAMTHYDRAIAADPLRAEAFANKGKALADLGHHERAVETLQKAVSMQGTSNAVAMLNLGTSLHALGRLEEAVGVYQHMLRLGHAESAGVHYGLALSLQHLGRVLDSAQHYHRALTLKPDYAEAALNLAALHHRYGSVKEALAHYHRALQLLQPHQSDPAVTELVIMTRNNLGLALTQLGDVASAIVQHQLVLSLLPCSPGPPAPSGFVGGPMKCRGEAMQPSGFVGGPMKCRGEAMQATSHIYRARRSVCDWTLWEETMDELMRDIDVRILQQGPIDSLLPFDTLSLPVSPSWRRHVALLFSRPFLPLSSPCPLPPLPPPPISASQRAAPSSSPFTPSPKLAAASLKIGYLCYDFNDHPTAHLVEGLFHHHTSPPLALSYGKDDNSTYRRSIERLTRPSQRFLELAPLGYTEAALAIRAAAPHIVVDLQGHTLGTRTEIIAQRVAPIQVNYLIYPGTSGAGFIDHIIADRYALPPDLLANGYTEKVVYMPHSYQVNFYTPAPSSPPPPPSASKQDENEDEDERERAHLRLLHNLPPSPAVVLANFNKADKLEPSIFRVWMGLLRRLPDSSVLWLLQPSNPAAAALIAENLRREAAAVGVSGDRLRFAPRAPKAEHLRRQKAADLFLDTFYYGAHSTATDALRGGLPVLTTPGDAFARRVGASLLYNVGLGEALVMSSFREFEDTGVWLCGSTEGREVLRGMRRWLLGQGQRSHLFDTGGCTRDLERGYEALWEMFVQNGGGGESENGDVRGAGNGTRTAEGKGDWRYHLVVTKREDAHVSYGQAEGERAADASGQAVV